MRSYGENQGLITAVAGVVLTLALAGCGQGGGTSGQGDDASSRPSSRGTSESSSPAPVSSAGSSAAILPAAADGTDLAACADGRCEVQVGASTKIPVPRRLQVAAVRVRSVGSDEITIVGRLLGNRQSGFCTGASCSSSGSGNEFTLVLGADSTGSENGLSITAVAIDGGRAVLRLAPA